MRSTCQTRFRSPTEPTGTGWKFRAFWLGRKIVRSAARLGGEAGAPQASPRDFVPGSTPAPGVADCALPASSGGPTDEFMMRFVDILYALAYVVFVLVTSLLALNFLGDGLRDAFDPRSDK